MGISYNLMIGPTPSGQGGMSSVVSQYQKNGTLAALRCVYVSSWSGGSIATKMRLIFVVMAKLLYGAILNRIRIIHIHSANRLSFLRKSLFIAVGSLFNIPVIFHLHSGEFFSTYESCNALQRWWIRSTLNRCAAIIILSPQWQRPMLQLINEPNKIRIVHNPINLNLPPDFTRKRRSSNQLTLLFLGSICEKKGVFDLLPVIAALREKGLNINIRCGGNGEVECFTAAIAEYKLSDAVHFLGWITEEQKINELEAADFFILPSYFEGQPMSILEAMLAGVPVISTTAGGIPDLITDGLNGFLVSPGDRIGMQTLLENIYSDLHCADELVEKARAVVNTKHNAQLILAQLQKLYTSIDPSSLQ